MTTKIKLELTWPGKKQRPRLKPRIPVESPAEYRARLVPSFRVPRPQQFACDSLRVKPLSDPAVPLASALATENGGKRWHHLLLDKQRVSTKLTQGALFPA